MKIGFAFSEHITQGRRGYAKKHKEDGLFPSHSFRGLLLFLSLVLLFFVLLGRLLWLQIVKGKEYRALSDSNRTRTETIHAPRGIIFDQNNIPLVFNTPGFRKIEKKKTRLISHKEALTLFAKGTNNISIDHLRKYPYADVSAHVIGYLGQISEDELKMNEFKDYQPLDVVGKMGIERHYEKILRGIDGKKLVEIDSRGKVIRTLGQTDPIPGKDITLTIDIALQKTAFEALTGIKKAIVIASKPNGEILALVSKPSFDPNLFTLGTPYKVATTSSYHSIEDILADDLNQPLVNRAVSQVYPPGSTFKIITAAAGLENGIIDEHFEVEDTGVLKVGRFSYSNWYYSLYGKTEGKVNIVKGIARSNDIFFYKLAEKVGVEKLSLMADAFGLGKRLGIDLPGEMRGVVPNASWKKEVIGEDWYLGDTYHYGIGQGYILVTPLQVNSWTAVIANGGKQYVPHLLEIHPPAGGSKLKAQNILGTKTTDLIREGMIRSCSPGGGAWPLFKFKIKNEKLKIDGRNILETDEATTSADKKDYRQIVIACKTGTAEHGNNKEPPHGWITLFAPAYDPQIVVTVLAEKSGQGSDVAAPVAKKVLEEWFGK